MKIITTKLRAAGALVALIALTGCEQIGPPLERVRIVHIGEDEETGNPDQYTIVEFPDGSRRMRWRHYGKVGDEFNARKIGMDNWR